MSNIQDARKKIEAYLRLIGLQPRFTSLSFWGGGPGKYTFFVASKEAMVLFVDKKMPVSHIRKFANKNLAVKKISIREIRKTFGDMFTESAFIITQKESRKNVRKSKKDVSTK